MSRGFGVAAGLEAGGRPSRSPRGARSSATPRCGPTTTPAPRASRRSPSSPGATERIDLGVAVHRARPPHARRDRRRHRAPRPPPRPPLGRRRRRVLEEAADGDARGRRRAARGAAGRAARARRDGPEDVRARRGRVRRRVLQLDDARVRGRRPRARPRGRGRRRPRPAAGLRLRPHRGRRGRDRSGSPRRSPSTATSTTATATTSPASASPRAPSASPPPTRDEAQRALAAYDGARHGRSCAASRAPTVEAMVALAEAAAPSEAAPWPLAGDRCVARRRRARPGPPAQRRPRAPPERPSAPPGPTARSATRAAGSPTAAAAS